MTLLHKGFDIVWRAVVVGIAYIAAMMLAGMLFGILGFLPAADPPANAAPAASVSAGLFWILVAGILLGLYLGPLARRTPATHPQHVLIWTAVIFFNMGAVVLEGAYFVPDLVPLPLPVLAGQQFLAALVAGGLLALLFARRGQTAAFLPALRRRRWSSWLWRFLLAAFSYLFFYFVFGALNYALVTGPYYASHAGGLTAPAGELVLAVELVRAPLLVLSVVLLILAAHTTRGRTLFVAQAPSINWSTCLPVSCIGWYPPARCVNPSKNFAAFGQEGRFLEGRFLARLALAWADGYTDPCRPTHDRRLPEPSRARYRIDFRKGAMRATYSSL